MCCIPSHPFSFTRCHSDAPRILLFPKGSVSLSGISVIASFLYVPCGFLSAFKCLHSVVPMYQYFGKRCLKTNPFPLQYLFDVHICFSYLDNFAWVFMVKEYLLTPYTYPLLPCFFKIISLVSNCRILHISVKLRESFGFI